MGKGKKGVRKGRGGPGSGGPPTGASTKREERAAKKQLKKKQQGRRFGDAEEREYEAQLAAIGGTINHMASDGNCLFRAIADQLEGKPEDHMRCRRKVVEYMEANPDDFAPFMEDDETWDDYVPRMKREREWGGHQEIVAASRLFKCNFVIHQLNAPRLEVHADNAKRTIHLSFHGESHYNSVRAADDPCRPGEPAKQWAGVASVAAPPTPAPAATGGKEKKMKKKGAYGHKQRREVEDGGEGQKEDAGGGVGGDGGDVESAAEGEEGEGPAEDVEEPEGAATAAAEPPPEGGKEGEDVDGSADGDKKDGVKAPGGQCPCGSGIKYRKCCRKADKQRQRLGGACGGGRKKQQQQQRGGGGGGSDEEDEEESKPRQKKKQPQQPPPARPSPSDPAAVDALASKVKAIAL